MELVVILKPEIVRQFKALGVLKKIDSNIFCYLNSKTLKKETKKDKQKTPKNLPKKWRERTATTFSCATNTMIRSEKKMMVSIATNLLTAKEYQDALVWDVQDLIETMNKLAI